MPKEPLTLTKGRASPSAPTRITCEKGWIPVVHTPSDKCKIDIQDIEKGVVSKCGMWGQNVYYCAKALIK